MKTNYPILFFSLVSTVCILLTACSDKKNNRAEINHKAQVQSTTKPNEENGAQSLEEEALPLSDLLVTFSTSNDLLIQYPSFKLDLYDIVAYIRTPTNLHSVSLYNLNPVSTEDFQSVLPVELSHLKKGNYLYQGVFKVPAGILESMQLKVVGEHANILINEKSPILIDPFFTTYTPGDSRLTARNFPATVTSQVVENITLEEGTVNRVNIEIDMNLTASMDPVEHTEPSRSYARFTPSITVAKPKNTTVVFRQVDLLNLNNLTLGIGNPEKHFFATTYSIAQETDFIIDGDEISSPSNLSGVYAIDLTGSLTFTDAGYHYTIERAVLAQLTENNPSAIIRGHIILENGEVIVQGNQQRLATDRKSLFGSMPFHAKIKNISTSNANLETGSFATIWFDGSTSKLLESFPKKTLPISQMFHLQPTLSFTPADILSIDTADSTDTEFTLTLSEALSCEHYVTSTATGKQEVCSEKIQNILFKKSSTGKFTLHETRKGKLSEPNQDGISNFLLEPDRVYHFKNFENFIATLSERIKIDHYRLSSFTAEGQVDASTFNITNKVKAVILQPNSTIDKAADDWISNSTSDSLNPLSEEKNNKISLYAGLGAAGIIGAAAILVLIKYIHDREPKIKQVMNNHKQSNSRAFPNGSTLVVGNDAVTPETADTAVRPTEVEKSQLLDSSIKSIQTGGGNAEIGYTLEDGNTFYIQLKDGVGMPITVIKGEHGKILQFTDDASKELSTKTVVDEYGKIIDESLVLDKVFSKRRVSGSIPILHNNKTGQKMTLFIASGENILGINKITSTGMTFQKVDLSANKTETQNGYKYVIQDIQKRKTMDVLLRFDGEIEVTTSSSSKIINNTMFALVSQENLEQFHRDQEIKKRIKTLPSDFSPLSELNKKTKDTMKILFQIPEDSINLKELLGSPKYYSDEIVHMLVSGKYNEITKSMEITLGDKIIQIDTLHIKYKNNSIIKTFDLTKFSGSAFEVKGDRLYLHTTSIGLTEAGSDDESFLNLDTAKQHSIEIARYDQTTKTLLPNEDLESISFELLGVEVSARFNEGFRSAYEELNKQKALINTGDSPNTINRLALENLQNQDRAKQLNPDYTLSTMEKLKAKIESSKLPDIIKRRFR